MRFASLERKDSDFPMFRARLVFLVRNEAIRTGYLSDIRFDGFTSCHAWFWIASDGSG